MDAVCSSRGEGSDGDGHDTLAIALSATITVLTSAVVILFLWYACRVRADVLFGEGLGGVASSGNGSVWTRTAFCTSSASA